MGERTGARQRELWRARSRDWADVQEMQTRPLFEAALDAADVGVGSRVLDAGCGAGGALKLAAERGARIAGLDATPELLAIAQERLPGVDLRDGDLEELPWADDSFSLVCGFNSFQFAGDPVRALAEARRVTEGGGRVVMATWGLPQDCQATAFFQGAAGLMPPPPPGAEGPFALSEPGKLEALIEQAGLRPVRAEEVETVWTYPDLETAVRGLNSGGPLELAARHSGEDALVEMTTSFAREYLDDNGEVRIRNVFRYVLAEA